MFREQVSGLRAVIRSNRACNESALDSVRSKYQVGERLRLLERRVDEKIVFFFLPHCCKLHLTIVPLSVGNGHQRRNDRRLATRT